MSRRSRRYYAMRNKRPGTGNNSPRVPVIPRGMEAKFDGECFLCDEPILMGELIGRWDEGKYYHAEHLKE